MKNLSYESPRIIQTLQSRCGVTPSPYTNLPDSLSIRGVLCTPEFKEEAVRKLTERGYLVAGVSERLGVSAHSLYKWARAVKPDNSGHQAQDLLDAKTEILKLKAQLKRTDEEQEILKKAARYFAREPD